MMRMALWLVFGAMACGQNLPLGQIIDDVPCKADGSQHYSLYLPSRFTPVRKWNVILAYDAGGRGRRAVERYQAAAEKYGYIIAGSNNSRNGPWEVSLNAAKAMTADVEQRFPVDPKRIYTAGMSGGARVAMKLAMDSELIAGVFALARLCVASYRLQRRWTRHDASSTPRADVVSGSSSRDIHKRCVRRIFTPYVVTLIK